MFHDGWVVRFADGLTRRANSANPLHAGARIDGPTIRFFETLFSFHALPLIVRVPSFLDPAVDGALQQSGFEAEGESCMLYADIIAAEARADIGVDIRENADEAWLKAINALQNRMPEQSAIYNQLIASIAQPTGFASLRENGEVAALAYGVLDGDMLCCKSVITGVQHRGKGYGRRLMSALLHWAERNGAAGVCLQVEAANSAGLALYHGLGLRELHRYHYRRWLSV